jgi:hypothetical protein
MKIYLIDIGYGGVDWIRLVKNKDQWRALLSTVVCLRIT